MRAVAAASGGILRIFHRAFNLRYNPLSLISYIARGLLRHLGCHYRLLGFIHNSKLSNRIAANYAPFVPPCSVQGVVTLAALFRGDCYQRLTARPHDEYLAVVARWAVDDLDSNPLPGVYRVSWSQGTVRLLDVRCGDISTNAMAMSCIVYAHISYHGLPRAFGRWNVSPSPVHTTAEGIQREASRTHLL